MYEWVETNLDFFLRQECCIFPNLWSDYESLVENRDNDVLSTGSRLGVCYQVLSQALAHSNLYMETVMLLTNKSIKIRLHTT